MTKHMNNAMYTGDKKHEMQHNNTQKMKKTHEQDNETHKTKYVMKSLVTLLPLTPNNVNVYLQIRERT